MSKKPKAVRTKPGSYVSIKVDNISLYAKFTRYAERVVLCKLRIQHKPKDPSWQSSWRWDIDDSREAKALCHPGDPEKNMPPDTFDEEVGMDLAYMRASKEFDKQIAEIKETIEYHEKVLVEGNAVLTNLMNAMKTLDMEYAKLKEEKLLVCEQK